MRAAAIDFPTARCSASARTCVSTVAVLIAGVLAAVVAVMLTVQFPTRHADFALQETILVLAGVVVGGMTRLLSATLGGFFDRLRVGPARRGAADRARASTCRRSLFGLVDPRAAPPAGRAVHARSRGLVERV
mgnify:CR=1 FL=1